MQRFGSWVLKSDFYLGLEFYFGLSGWGAMRPFIQESHSCSLLLVPHLLHVMWLEDTLAYLLSARPFELNIRFYSCPEIAGSC